MQEKFITYHGSSIVYHVYGNGEPVMLIHGFGEDSGIWEQQVTHLAPLVKLLIPDLPGSGKSGFINMVTGIEDYADVLQAILLNERIERCIMIGHSMGGYITLAFAEKYEHMLSAFGLFHSSSYADDEAKKDMREKAIGFIHKNGTEAFLKTSIPGLFYGEGNASTVAALIEKGRNFLPEALVQYYQAMMTRKDRSFILKKSSLPVLMIMGEHDKAVPFLQSLQQSHMPNNADIHILRDSAHMGMLEEPDRSAEILANFLLNR